MRDRCKSPIRSRFRAKSPSRSGSPFRPLIGALRAKILQGGTAASARPPRFQQIAWARRFASQSAYRALYGMGSMVPRDSIYLNVAQHAFEHHRFFRWLDPRPDVVPVFLIHDLLPLDFSEFFPPGCKHRFERRVETMIARARASSPTWAIWLR